MFGLSVLGWGPTGALNILTSHSKVTNDSTLLSGDKSDENIRKLNPARLVTEPDRTYRWRALGLRCRSSSWGGAAGRARRRSSSAPPCCCRWPCRTPGSSGPRRRSSGPRPPCGPAGPPGAGSLPGDTPAGRDQSQRRRFNFTDVQADVAPPQHHQTQYILSFFM